MKYCGNEELKCTQCKHLIKNERFFTAEALPEDQPWICDLRLQSDDSDDETKKESLAEWRKRSYVIRNTEICDKYTNKGYTYTDLAKEYGLTNARICQILKENNAVNSSIRPSFDDSTETNRKEKHVTLCLSENMYDFINGKCEKLDINQSAYLRFLILCEMNKEKGNG